MRMRSRLSLMMLCAAAMGWALPAHADPGRAPAILCYVWADNPTSSFNVPYSPSSTYSYNVVGRDQANTVTRTATGSYTVVCKGVGGGALGTTASAEAETQETAASAEEKQASADDKASTWGGGGHVQVTAYGGEDADHCKVLGWSTGAANLTAFVKCYNYKGKAADSRFDLLFVW